MSSETFKPVVRPAELTLRRRDWDPGIGADETNISRAMGLTQLGASYFEVKPGDAAFPFHVHYQEDEIIIVLEGEGTYRFGEARHEVKAGDVLSAPMGGTAHAHQLVNTGERTLKYVCVSTLPSFNIVELPELGLLRVNERKQGGRRLEFPFGRDSK